MPPKTKVVIFTRVSTQKQNSDRQEFELRELCKQRGWDVASVVSEVISGAAGEDDRHGLKEAALSADKHAATKILVHEVSRIARKAGTVHSFVDDMAGKGISVYCHNPEFETLDSRGKISISGTVILGVLSSLAVTEREAMRERVVSGLARAKREGRLPGRPKGQKQKGKETGAAFLKFYSRQTEQMRRNPNASWAELKGLTGLSVGTLRKLRGLQQQEAA